MRPVIYVAGPYRAVDWQLIDMNIEIARAQAIKLWQQGWAVICPHLNTAHFDGYCEGHVWLEGYLEILKLCAAIYMLPGWGKSDGARTELAKAVVWNKQICYDMPQAYAALQYLQSNS